ncbi:hypothetical protein HAX54_043047, partial [Datura stramonium]|nr:hypothetical protein [Datura stramonium]
ENDFNQASGYRESSHGGCPITGSRGGRGPTNRSTPLWFEKMEAYYVSFQKKWSITAEARFEGTAGPLKEQRPSGHDALLIIHI